MTRNTSRRKVLQALGGAGALAMGVSLAGCSSSSGAPNPTTESGDDGSDGGSSGGASKTSTVEMTDELTFDPKTIEVSAGTTVTWKNTGSIGHTITAYEDKIPDGAAYFASGGFDSEQAAKDGYPTKGNVVAGESYEHTFETTGTYEYYCIPHELNGMVGTVKVV